MVESFWLYGRIFPHMVSHISLLRHTHQNTMVCQKENIDILLKPDSRSYPKHQFQSRIGHMHLPLRSILSIGFLHQSYRCNHHIKNCLQEVQTMTNYVYLAARASRGLGHTIVTNWRIVHFNVSSWATH